jgi:hypothetical protein
MWCCSRHSVQVLLSSMSKALLLEPSYVFWQLWTAAVCFYILQLVLPTMIVIVTTVLIWLILVSTALHAAVIHCREIYVAVSCQTWLSCSVTYLWVCNLSGMKLRRNSAFLILKLTVWGCYIFPGLLSVAPFIWSNHGFVSLLQFSVYTKHISYCDGALNKLA